MKRRWTAWAMAAGAMLLAACQRQDPNALDATAYDAVAFEAEAELNEPVTAIFGVLRTLDTQSQAGWDTLVINLDGTPEPVNWWLLDRGWIELAGAQFVNRAAFNLTQSGRDLTARPDPAWFTVAIDDTSEPSANCQSAAALAAAGCEVFLTLQPALTDEGRRVLGAIDLPPAQTTAMVTIGLEDWAVVSLSPVGDPFYQQAMRAILGDEDARRASLLAANERLADTLQMLGGQPVEIGPSQEAYAPPNYVEPPPPVAPQGLDEDPRRAPLGVGLPDAALP